MAFVRQTQMGAGADEVRAYRQPQDRQGARSHRAAFTAWTRRRGDRIDRFVAMHESAIASVVVFSRNIPARVVRHEGCRNKAHDRANSDIDRNGIATMVRGE